MAQVTYRGVKYDTNRDRPIKTGDVSMTYRGHKFVKKLETAS